MGEEKLREEKSNYDNKPSDELNLEREKFELEKERIHRELMQKEHEVHLKERELEFKQQELTSRLEDQRNRFLRLLPLTVVLVTAFAGLIGSGLVYLQGVLNRDLERKKFESSLILEAVKAGDPQSAAKNLDFFLKAGFIEDTDGRIKAMVNKPTTIDLPPPDSKSSGR